jgi:hypothetical protein
MTMTYFYHCMYLQVGKRVVTAPYITVFATEGLSTVMAYMMNITYKTAVPSTTHSIKVMYNNIKQFLLAERLVGEARSKIHHTDNVIERT